MNDEQSPASPGTSDIGEGELQVALTTVIDDEGAGWESELGDRWDVEVYLPGEPSAAPVTVAEATAFTVRAPESLAAIVEAIGELQISGDYADALTRLDETAGSFAALFETSAEALDRDDLLIIESVRITEGHGEVPGLLARVLRALQGGPSGRTAAFVLTDASQWAVPLDDDALQRLGLARWADTKVVGCINGDVATAQMRIAEFIASQLEDEDDLVVGARADDLWLADMIEQAQASPAIRVRFDLPPALPANVWAGAPADVHDVTADPETGTITIETHDATYEVVGAPGTAAQLVGAATEASPQTREWLRAVHERWWRYEDALHERVHEAVAEFTEGRLEEVPDETTPYLHMSEIMRDLAPWPLPGEVHLIPLEGPDEAAGGHMVEQVGPLVFHAVREEDGQAGHEHIGVVRLYPNGHIQAWLLDDWMIELPDHEAAVEHLLALGADVFIADVLHEELYGGVVDAILTGDVRGH